MTRDADPETTELIAGSEPDASVEAASVLSAKTSSGRTLLWLSVGTAFYVFVAVVLVAQTEACAPVPNYLRATWALQLLDDYLRCRSLNELGDFLAGAFAPLAFIWLAGTVFIQSRELAAQREELSLARDEAQQTRKVLSRQARESEASTEFIGEQTRILKRREAQHAQEYAEEEFDAVVAALQDRLTTSISFSTITFKIIPPDSDTPTEWTYSLKPSGENSTVNVFRQLNLQAARITKAIRVQWHRLEGAISVDVGGLTAIVRALERIDELYRAMPEAHRVRNEQLNYRSALDNCQRLARLVAHLRDPREDVTNASASKPTIKRKRD